MPSCSNCGKDVQGEGNFCSSCGHNLKGAQSQGSIVAEPPVSRARIPAATMLYLLLIIGLSSVITLPYVPLLAIAAFVAYVMSLVVVYSDCKKLKEQGVWGESPSRWAFLTAIVWIIFLPWYMYKRSNSTSRYSGQPAITAKSFLSRVKERKILVGIVFFIGIIVLGSLAASQTAPSQVQQVAQPPQVIRSQAPVPQQPEPAPAPVPQPQKPVPVQAPAPAPAPPPPAPQQPLPAPAPQQAPKPKTYAIGDRVVVGELAFTLKEIKTTSRVGGQYFGENAEGIFVIVILTIENLGRETKTISSDIVSVKDSQGRVFKSSNIAWIHLENNLLLKQLQPDLPATGEAIFDLPKNVGKISLQVSDGRLFSSKTELIELGSI